MYICDHANECGNPNCNHKNLHTHSSWGTCDRGLCGIVDKNVECVEVVSETNKEQKKEKTMSNINHLQENKPSDVYIKDIPYGTFFYGYPYAYPNLAGNLFLRTFDGIVNLDNPKSTWTKADNTVKEYVPVDVTITVNRKI